MKKTGVIENFSKLSRNRKISIISELVANPIGFITHANAHLHEVDELQSKYEGFSENTITNYFLPFGIAPNFLINGNVYHVPMVTEESSVIAAAASAAKFWLTRGGFNCSVVNTIKKGQVHFEWHGQPDKLMTFFAKYREALIYELEPLIRNMKSRGGGLIDIQLLHKPEVFNGYYQLDASFETADSMGANFINSCLERLAQLWARSIKNAADFISDERSCVILMSILSNYTPDCRVVSELKAPISSFDGVYKEMDGKEFVSRFIKSVQVANGSISRAVTNNKGIFNGIDAVMVATGNDFRAVEACGHAYASQSGQYKSLTSASTDGENLLLRLEIPLSIGTVGGLTALHPMASLALEILGSPTASELMNITAAVGLASNFSAIRALITSGIQKGHMKMHLTNIFAQLNASIEERERASTWFSDKDISFSTVSDFILALRKK
jgi:hydroxymethylglutaryl-CoA reductase